MLVDGLIGTEEVHLVGETPEGAVDDLIEDRLRKPLRSFEGFGQDVHHIVLILGAEADEGVHELVERPRA